MRQLGHEKKHESPALFRFLATLALGLNERDSPGLMDAVQDPSLRGAVNHRAAPEWARAEKRLLLCTANSADLDRLTAVYRSVFGAPGDAQSPLRSLSLGGPEDDRRRLAADLASFYQAFGQDAIAARAAPDDHLATMLALYGAMVSKTILFARAADHEGMEIVATARRRFLDAHLLKNALAITNLHALERNSTWCDIFALVARVVVVECQSIGVDANLLSCHRMIDRMGATAVT